MFLTAFFFSGFFRNRIYYHTEDLYSCMVSNLWTLGEDQLTQDDLCFPPALQRISAFCIYQLEVKKLRTSKGEIIPDFTFSQINYSVEDNQQLGKCKFLEELGIQEVSVTYLWICLTFTGFEEACRFDMYETN